MSEQPPIQIQLPPVFQEIAAQWPLVLQRLTVIEAQPAPSSTSTYVLLAVSSFVVGVLTTAGGLAYWVWG